MLQDNGDTFTSSINLALCGRYDDRGSRRSDDNRGSRRWDDDRSSRRDDHGYTLIMEMMIVALLEAIMMIVTIYVDVMMTGDVIVGMIVVIHAMIVMIAAPMVAIVIVQLLHMWILYARFARFMVILQVIVGGGMRIKMILMMIPITRTRIRLPTLLLMVLIQIGTLILELQIILLAN
jgi:hypothetical protein